VENVKKVLSPDRIAKKAEIIEKIYIDEKLIDYIVTIVARRARPPARS